MIEDLSNIVGVTDWDSRVVEITPVNEAAAISRLAEWFAAGKVYGVSLKGFVDSSLPLLEEMRFIEFLHIGGWCKNLDLERLSLLDNLRTLRIGDGVTNRSYDLSSLKSLESATVVWKRDITGFSSLQNLRFLALWRAKRQDIQALELPGSITELRLVHGAFESLRGISKLNGIARLELSYLSRLRDIEETSKLDHLQRLNMQNLRSISSYKAIGMIHSLLELYVENCAPIASMDWMNGLNNLERLSFYGTKILDKNLSFVTSLNRLISFSITQGQGYTPPLKEIFRILEERRDGRAVANN